MCFAVFNNRAVHNKGVIFSECVTGAVLIPIRNIYFHTHGVKITTSVKTNNDFSEGVTGAVLILHKTENFTPLMRKLPQV